MSIKYVLGQVFKLMVMKKRIIQRAILAVAIILLLVGAIYYAYPYKFHINEDGTLTLDKYIGVYTDVKIPETIFGKKVAIIGEMCFCENERIKYVYIPETIETIERKAFYDCINLEKVEGGESVKYIMEGVFDRDKKLYSIFPLTNLKEINDCVFWGCRELEDVEISENVTYIGAAAFSDTKVDYTIVPSGTKYVDGTSFSGLREKDEFIIVGDGIILRHPDRESIEIPEGVKMVCTFQSRRNDITEVMTLPNTVLFVEYDVLEGSEHGTIYIPESVVEIGEYLSNKFNEVELVDVVKICGIKGSYAEDYAKRYNIPFEEVERWY